MEADVLPLVDLTPAAVIGYFIAVKLATADMIAAGVRLPPDEFPDERGLIRDGKLVVYVDVPTYGRIEYEVPGGQWAWRDRN